MTIFGYKPNGSAWVGILIVGFFVFLAIFAPWIAPYSQAETVSDTWAPSSSAFWMGTDQIGRDMMSRIIYGARMTIGIALATTVLSFLIGTTLGLLASDGDDSVRVRVARHRRASLSLLATLRTDESWVVREAAEEAPRLRHPPSSEPSTQREDHDFTDT